MPDAAPTPDDSFPVTASALRQLVREVVWEVLQGRLMPQTASLLATVTQGGADEPAPVHSMGEGA